MVGKVNPLWTVQDTTSWENWSTVNCARHDWLGNLIHCKLCKTWLVGKVDPLWTVQDMTGWESWSSVNNLIVCTQAWIRVGEWDSQNSLGSWDKSRSPNPCQKNRLCDNLKKKQKKKTKKNCRIVDFSVLADPTIKIKESEKYLDLEENQVSWRI